jgi:hypothetical protein
MCTYMHKHSTPQHLTEPLTHPGLSRPGSQNRELAHSSATQPLTSIPYRATHICATDLATTAVGNAVTTCSGEVNICSPRLSPAPEWCPRRSAPPTPLREELRTPPRGECLASCLLQTRSSQGQSQRPSGHCSPTPCTPCCKACCMPWMDRVLEKRKRCNLHETINRLTDWLTQLSVTLFEPTHLNNRTGRTQEAKNDCPTQ